MKISHIAIWVRDLENIKNFYIKYFKCKCSDKYINKKTYFESYFLNFEDDLRLEIMTKKGIKERNTNDEMYGFAHISISVGSKEKIESLTE
ncbi:VOC family protein [uncultured Brachyspira sp.]|uniref:VOC family protein n=1 Tax=uncultured Brachyspira sp. TaxID=221953 RepID=UPI0025EDDA84|nr:VOC family protein [uncultured Brachyspira sp.]